MNNSAFSYLNFINFSNLYNWSVQYAQRKYTLNNDLYDLVPINEFLTRVKEPVTVEDNLNYKRVSIRLYNAGIGLRDIEKGINIGTKKQFRVHTGQFLLSKIDARNGAFGVVPEICDNAIITGNFWTFDVNYEKVNPYFLTLVMTSDFFIKLSEQCSNGTTNRHYLQENLFLDMKIPLPPLEKQKEIVDRYNEKIKLAEKQEKEAQNLEQEINKYIFSELGLKIKKDLKQDKLLNFVKFSNLKLWGVDKICGTNRFYSEIYKLHTLNDICDLYIEAFRGKSPKYENNSNSIILNQKCNRWNSIDLNFAKTVSESWANSIDNNFKTQEGDILINSTGEGTIGRASYISKENIGLLYDSHILLLRLNKQKINPLYYTYLFNSCFGQDQIDFVKSAQSTKQTELGIDNLKKIKFPYPDMDVQNEIVDTITKLKAKIEKLNNLAEQNRKLAQEEFEKELFE